MNRLSLSWILSLIAYAFYPGSASALNDPYHDYAKKPVQELWKLAVRYEHGEGVLQNYDEAIRLYCVAARKGFYDASFQLGWIYANGRGVERNETIAAAWFDDAAKSGDLHASRMLDRLGIKSDDEQRKCLLTDGSEYLQPLESVPDPDRELIRSWVERLAPDYELQARLVLAVIETESNFNCKARSLRNAQGLMQLIPETARRFGVSDIWDPLDNLRGGMAYLRWLLDYFDGDLTLALAGYNAGENAVTRHQGIPPYTETRSYVKQVLHLLQKTGA